ncbi:hypothetical protein P4O66_010204 [Electrophorus voltai]|uniref:Uncharacterized protein n=1 Tax=Electrophorus voltai TaxID=2609070 RepID=A0AAD8Z9B7_9TELE|nr:hypothetical protein P4O66_010204 [Electrophorus voltai]
MAYLEEIKNLENWCQDNTLHLNVSKTKELTVDCSKKQERSYHPLFLSTSWSLPPQNPEGLYIALKGAAELLYLHHQRHPHEEHHSLVWEQQYRQNLQRVVCSAEHIIQTKIADLQTIYYQRCWTKARKIVKDPSHPNN